MKKRLAGFAFAISTTIWAAIFTPAFGASVPEAQAGKGLVVFYPDKKFKGAAMRFRVTNEQEEMVGNLSNGSTFSIDLAPGEYTFSVRAPSVDGSDSITVNVDAGETYFVQGEILFGWPASGRPRFNLVTEATALNEIKKF